MSKDPKSYEAAMSELDDILKSLESENTNIDKLSSLVKRAQELVSFCKTKLRVIGDELNETIGEEE